MSTIEYRDEVEDCCNGAPVLKISNTRQYILNGYPAGVPIVVESHYECDKCGKILKALARSEQ